MNPPFVNIGSRSFSPTFGKIHVRLLFITSTTFLLFLCFFFLQQLSESPSLSSYSISANSPPLSPAETPPRRFSSPTNGGSGSARRMRCEINNILSFYQYWIRALTIIFLQRHCDFMTQHIAIALYLVDYLQTLRMLWRRWKTKIHHQKIRYSYEKGVHLQIN